MRSGPILVSLAVPIHSLLQGRPKIESVIYNVVHSVHLIWSALVNIRRKALLSSVGFRKRFSNSLIIHKENTKKLMFNECLEIG